MVKASLYQRFKWAAAAFKNGRFQMCGEKVWRNVPGFEGLYHVSNEGNIINCRTGKELIPYNHPKGYLKVDLSSGKRNGHGKQLYVHRIVAEAFLPNRRNLPQINHKNCDKHDNRICNLEWCTNEYNQAYRAAISKYKKMLEE